MHTLFAPALVPGLLFSIACLSSGCAGLDDFEVEITDEAVIDGSYMANVTGQLGFGGNYQGLKLSATKEFSDQGIDPDDVDAVYVQSISIVATNPENARLDSIIELVEFNIQAPGQQTELLGRSLLPDGTELREISIGQPSGGLCSDKTLTERATCESAGQEWTSRVVVIDPEMAILAGRAKGDLVAPLPGTPAARAE